MKKIQLDDAVTWRGLLDQGDSEIGGVDRSDIERQWVTATEILNRFTVESRPAVLLGDEVGMGKTFVALATMAAFANSIHGAKILLVVPRSDVLKKKWMQDIDTFDAQYTHKKGPALLRPVEVNNILDLLMAANEYTNNQFGSIRNSSHLKYAFLYELWSWAKERRNSGVRAHWKKWIASQGMEHKEQFEFVDAYQTMSAFALRGFFDSTPQAQELVNQLSARGRSKRGRESKAAPVNQVLKAFLEVQTKYLPNVFVIRMGRLGLPKGGSDDRMTFGSALLDRLCTGREISTLEDVYRTLDKSSYIWSKFHFGKKRWSDYIQDVRSLKEPWGVKKYLGTPEGQKLIQEHVFKLGKRSDELSWTQIYNGLRRGEYFKEAEGFIESLGRKVVRALIERADFTLAVVDEVHNWKSGRSNGASDYRKMINGTIEKTLLLSATPFQIDPDEFKTLFEVAVCPQSSSDTAKAIESLYGAEGGLVHRCINESAVFHKRWASLSPEDLEIIRQSATEKDDFGAVLDTLLGQPGHSTSLYTFLKATQSYHSSLQKLSESLRGLMIRHTKERVRRAVGKPQNRHYHSGCHYQKDPGITALNQVPRLPSARGYTPEDEDLALFEFVAMRFDQLLGDYVRQANSRSEKRKSQAAHLMAGLTSSLSAFQESQESKRGNLKVPLHLTRYKECLTAVASGGQMLHPKVEATCSRLLANWELGRKTLVFCYRVATVEEIVETVNQRIKVRLDELTADIPFLQGDIRPLLRRSYLYREDRLWLSFILSQLQEGEALQVSSLYQKTKEYLRSQEFAVAMKKAGQNIASKQSDRERSFMWWLDALCFYKFLVDDPQLGLKAPPWLMRHLRELGSPEMLVEVLEKATVTRRESAESSEGYTEDSNLDEIMDDDGREFKGRSEISAGNFGEKYLESASMWVVNHDDARLLHKRLWDLWDDEAQYLSSENSGTVFDGSTSFWLRGQMVRTVRNILLRPDMIVRLLTAPDSDTKINPGAKLQDHFHNLAAQTYSYELGGQTMVRRVADYLLALLKASGTMNPNINKESRRRALFEGANQVDHKDKAPAIKGLTGKNRETRSRICQAFNSPLMPDALVCTSIGQEGIDLHLYCAEVIHHDLPWNPAVLEQRTGRVDRVRSLSERESAEGQRSWIQIGVPFLGNNYDQYQYDVLVQRAQMFDILMGDESVKNDWERAENESCDDDNQDIALVEEGVKDLGDGEGSRILPETLVKYLSLDLSVWQPTNPKKGSGKKSA